MNSLLLWLGLIAPADVTIPVAVQASYTLHTQATSPVVQECCGLCENGIITHGDGHKSPCPCPPDCKCKAVTHPPTILRAECPDGKCTPKK